MRDVLSFAVGAAAGALAMYYLDAQSGRRRRALVRDQAVAAGHDAAYYARTKGKRAMDHLQGIAATGRLDRVSHSEPESDRQLQDRIRSRLGRLVSHPGAVQVDVERGSVWLRGHILTKEQNALLQDVHGMAGVESVRNALVCHDSAEGVPELQGRSEPRGKEQRPAGLPTNS